MNKAKSIAIFFLLFYSMECRSLEDWKCWNCNEKKSYRDLSIGELKKRAESGDPEAEFGLSERYKMGRGVEINTAEYFKWLKRSATGGHAHAQYEMSIHYDEIIGPLKNIGLNDIRPDAIESIRWLKMAADQNHLAAIKGTRHVRLVVASSES